MSDQPQITKKQRIAAFKRGLAQLQAQTGVHIQIVSMGSDDDFELSAPSLGYVITPDWQPPEPPKDDDTP